MGANPRRRGRLPFVLLLITTLTVAGCGGGNDDSSKDLVSADAGIDALVAAAKKEGKVTVYSAQGLDALNNLAAAFEKEYPGIDVEPVRGVDGDLSVKVETEFQTGRGIADMFVTASLPWVQTEAKAGKLLAPTGPELTGKGKYDCADPAVIGAPFSIMSYVDGRVLRDGAEAAELTAAEARRCAEALVDELARLHAIDPVRVGLGDLGRPAGYLERQVRRWHGQWARVATRELPAYAGGLAAALVFGLTAARTATRDA